MEETPHPGRDGGSVETRAVPEFVFHRAGSSPHGSDAANLTAGISYEDLFEAAPDAMLVVDKAGRIILANHQAEQLFGYERPELLGRDFETLIPERFRSRHRGYRSAYFANPQVRPMGSGLDLYALRKDGTEFPVEISLSPRRSPGPLAVICSVRDVTPQKQAARAIRESEERFRATMEHAAVGKGIADLEGRWLQVNRALCELVGYSEAELLQTTFQALTHPDDLDNDLASLGRLLAGEIRFYHMEKRYLHKKGHVIWILLSASLVRDEQGQPLYLIGQAQDITELKRAEEERARLLESERRKSEQLQLAVREAHHRIKNNLQAITDLLSLELDSADESAASMVLRESIDRVQAIAIVHDLLSHEEDVEVVDVARLADRLVPSILQSSGVPPGGAAVRVEVSSVLLPSKQATAVALILNELVNNAAKHALRGRQGQLEIRFHELNANRRLSVWDDGPGLPARFDINRHANVGLQVVQVLTKTNLNGDLALISEQGLRVEIRFPADPERHS